MELIILVMAHCLNAAVRRQAEECTLSRTGHVITAEPLGGTIRIIFCISAVKNAIDICARDPTMAEAVKQRR